MSEAGYNRRAGEMNETYRDAFAALSPAKRAALKKHGIEGPEVINHESSQGPRDVSEFTHLAAPRWEITDAQRRADELTERFDIPPKAAVALLAWIEDEIEREAGKRKAHLLARLAGPLVGMKNPKVSILGLAFACEFRELNISGCGTMREAAKKAGCSAAYISQHANYWADLLEIPRPKGMKSPAARASYKTARKKNHWRHQKCPTPPQPTP